MAIIDLLLSLSNDKDTWEVNLPIGSESVRLLEIIKHLSRCLFDFQRLNYYSSKDEDDETDMTLKIFESFKNSNNIKRKKIFYLLPPYILFDIKLEHIGNFSS